ncbi:MAG TPA: hypothetical protein PKC49_00405 [Phycisphaerae bacterium]|nr:hypothetical protein [Phycisphaerae bacterium]
MSDRTKPRTTQAPSEGRIVLVFRRGGWSANGPGGPRAGVVNSCIPDARPHPLVNVTVFLAPFDPGTREQLARDGLDAPPVAVDALRELPLLDAGHPGTPEDALPQTWAEWPPRAASGAATPSIAQEA